MPISETRLSQLLFSAFPHAKIQITDFMGDEDHYLIKIRDHSFQKLNMVQQHQSVYKALDGYVGTHIHALRLDTGDMDI